MKAAPLRLGLIGWPVEHSLSPRLHQAALRAAGLAGEYRLYPIPRLPMGEGELRGLIERLRTGELHGLNVTIPHKQAVIPLLDRLSPTAQAIGAVNTLFCRDGRLEGDNTDPAGFLADLGSFLDYASVSDAGEASALVLGAGGAARAVVYALMQNGWQVIVAARRLEQAQRLVGEIGIREQGAGSGEREAGSRERESGSRGQGSGSREQESGSRERGAGIRILEMASVGEATGCCLIINCTPVGMSPRVQDSPWPASAPFPKGAALYDLVYNPRETALVRAARQAGLPAVTGLGMLIEQAALSFECWTGEAASRQAMRAMVF